MHSTSSKKPELTIFWRLVFQQSQTQRYSVDIYVKQREARNLTFEEPVPENVWLFACEITLSSQTMKQHCSVFPTERLCAFFLNCFESLPTAHNSGPTRLSSPVLSTSLPHYSFFFNSCGWASTGGRLLLIMKPFETKETNFCTEWKCNNQAH